MDFALDEEHRLLRAAVEEFAARDVAPRVRERDQEARFPTLHL